MSSSLMILMMFVNFLITVCESAEPEAAGSSVNVVHHCSGAKHAKMRRALYNSSQHRQQLLQREKEL